MNNKSVILMLSIILIIASLSCISSSNVTPAPVVNDEPNNLIPETDIPAEDVNLISTATSSSPTEISSSPVCSQIESSKVCVKLDPRLQLGTPTNALAEPDTFMGENEPGYVKFIMEAYPLVNSFQTPEIRVYPLDTYRQSSETAYITISQFEELLQIQYDPPEFVPILPAHGASQLFHAKVKYSEAGCCKGMRFITQLGQDVSLINNDQLVYVYQGITKDDQYLISAIFPVSHPSLPEEWSDLPDNVYDIYSDYILETQALLTDYEDTSYYPSLDDLDALSNSIIFN